MLFRLYFWSIGPVSLISVYTDWISYDLYHLIYAPIFWLTDNCPMTHARYCRLIETWWLLDWIFGVPLWNSSRMQSASGQRSSIESR